jgi:hypothetical protein
MVAPASAIARTGPPVHRRAAIQFTRVFMFTFLRANGIGPPLHADSRIGNAVGAAVLGTRCSRSAASQIA